MLTNLMEFYRRHKLSLIVCAGVWLLNFLLWGIFAIAGNLGPYIYALDLILCAVFVLAVCLSIKKCGFPSLEVLFLGCLFLFAFSRLFLHLFGIYDFMRGTYAIYDSFVWEDKTAVTVLNSYLVFLSVFCLYLLIHKKKRSPMPRVNPFPAKRQMLLVCYCVFAVSAVIFAAYSLRQVAVVKELGYGGIYNGSVSEAFNPGPLFSVSRLAFTVAIYMICTIEQNEKRFNIAFAVYLLVMGIQLLQGSRLEFIVVVLTFLYLRFRLFKRKISLPLAGVLMVLGVLGIYFIACLRAGNLGDFSISGALRYFFVNMSGSLNVPAYYVQNKEGLSHNTYPYVLDAIVRIGQMILHPDMASGQSLELIQYRFNLGHQITYHISAKYYLSGAGVGNNFIAELLEFGIPGVLIGSFVLVKLISLFDEHIGHNLYLRFMAPAFVGKILIVPRAELFYDTYNLVKYGAIFCVIYLAGKFFYRSVTKVSKQTETEFDFEQHYAQFIKGIENRHAFGKGAFSKKRTVKMLLYYILIAIFSPYDKRRYNKAFFVAGKSHRNWDFQVDTQITVYRGFCYRSVSELWKLYTVLSPYRRFERLVILTNMVSVYLKNKKDIVYLSAWLEYTAFNLFFKKLKLTDFTARNHFDEFATWFGIFAQQYGFKLHMYQHGVVYDSIVLPHKIYCDEFYAFDNYSIRAFRNNYHGNPDCKYTVYPFPASISFDEVEQDAGVLHIGIAEQHNPQWAEKVIAIASSVPDSRTFVMLHPLSDCNYGGEGVSLEKSRKIRNLDVLITDSSTLAIDYYREMPDIKVLFTSALIKNCFADYPFVFVEDLDRLKEYLLAMKKEKQDA